MSSVTRGILGILALLVIVAIIPLIVMWVMNTLFGLGLAYTPYNWLAAFVLCLILIALNAL